MADYNNNGYIQEVTELHRLCDEANKEDPGSWGAILHWLNANPTNVSGQGAEHRGEFDATPLHIACRNSPPAEVVMALLAASPETVTWEDAFSWLPLHYACANGASEEVIEVLTAAHPPSKTATDKRNRTPLHFALGNATRQASPGQVEILSDSGAAAKADENGSLPLHYACAYGATEDVLKILLRVIPTSTAAVDIKGRTPLHFALGNADRATSPAVVQLLLEKTPGVANETDDEGQLPVHLLAAVASKTPLGEKGKKKRESAMKCLDSYLNAKPTPTADHLTALQSFPEWLLDHAVISEDVQMVLNEKISQRFPTSILLMDFYILIMIIISFHYASDAWIKEKNNSGETEDYDDYVIFMFVGAAYFSLRELVQILSLITLDNFSAWYTDIENVFDLILIGVTIASAAIMKVDDVVYKAGDDTESIQTFFAVVFAIMWMSVLMFLKSAYIDFAVFVGGVLYVVNKLVAFLLALFVILLAFSQAFVMVFMKSDRCPETKANEPLQRLMESKFVTVGMLHGVYAPWGFGEYDICDARKETSYKFEAPVNTFDAVFPFMAPSSSMAPSALFPSDSPTMYPSWDGLTDEGNRSSRWEMSGEDYCIKRYKEMFCGGENCIPFCASSTSFIRVYTMLLGEVDETQFRTKPTAQVYYFIFALLVAILLVNVLIAIVTDSYGVIRNQRAEIVFWTNRLDFVAEIGSIGSGIIRIRALLFGYDDDDYPVDRNDSVSRVSKEPGTWEDLGGSLWTKLVELFNDENLSFFSLDFWCYSLSRLFALFVIFPVWLALGFATAGWLWPPQVRRWLFVQKFTKRRTDELLEFHAESYTSLTTLKNDNAEIREQFAELGGDVNRIIDSLKSY